MILIPISILTIVLALFIWWYLADRYARIKIVTLWDYISKAVQHWTELENQSVYFTHSQSRDWIIQHHFLRDSIGKSYRRLRLPEDLQDIVDKYIEIHDTGEALREKRNIEFVEREKEIYSTLFPKFTEYPLSDEQIYTILHDEDVSLVIAGAGTGKTSAIEGKVVYLLNAGLAEPNEILAVAFTTKAAGEMDQRLSGHLKGDIKVKTFHALGNEILGHVEGKKPDIAFNGSESLAQKFIDKKLDELWDRRSHANRVSTFFGYYLKPIRTIHGYLKKGDWFRDRKRKRLISIDGRWNFKSQEEVAIANFLWTNRIKYEYEPIYREAPTGSTLHRPYHPDFYLPDHSIYIEHFGVDREGNVPSFFVSRSGRYLGETYQSQMKWKRDLHERHRTTLIETYSYEASEGVLFTELERKLDEYGVLLRPRSPQEIKKALHKRKELTFFSNLLHEFIVLMKSNQYVIQGLRKAAESQSDHRFLAFLNIVEPIYQQYEQHLQKHEVIDFADMINRATQHVQDREYESPYRYILADEFQDMSIGRYNLLKALLGNQYKVKLFAVGDDWQSIFRFTGSDISLMMKIDDYFGYSHQSKLERTFRFHSSICDVTNEFIQQNPSQLRKNLKPERKSKDPGFSIFRSSTGDVDSVLEDILNDFSKFEEKLSVFVIGRYKDSKPRNLSSMQRQFPNLDIEYHTAHTVKGLTCDYSVITGIVSGRHGFPCEILDDPVLQHVLHESDPYPFAEERRLFYVATTRARFHNYLVTDNQSSSHFIREIEQLCRYASKIELKECSSCGGRMVKRRGRHGEFWGCENYTLCKKTVDIPKPHERSSEDYLSTTLIENDEDDFFFNRTIDEEEEDGLPF